MEAYRYLARVYDEFMADVDYEKWAAYIDEILKQKQVRRIYEAACGTGNITNGLYALGYDIIASDISEEMIGIASEKARQHGNDIIFVLSDMRHIDVGNKVDAVIAACDGANYIDFEGIKMFAASAHTSLKNGGLLLFDIITMHKIKDVLNGQVYFDDSDDAACIWKNTYDEKKNVLQMDMTLFIRQGSLFERFSERHIQYAHDTADLRQAMMAAGFVKVDIFDCFTNNIFDEWSQRVQFVCYKE
ncbi:MAG: class I SAM-dependent methyltransferase [Eubacteriales bacterium]|nr:class I SAM-dependent methyltransferase [Eubacteriales bacterium]